MAQAGSWLDWGGPAIIALAAIVAAGLAARVAIRNVERQLEHDTSQREAAELRSLCARAVREATQAGRGAADVRARRVALRPKMSEMADANGEVLAQLRSIESELVLWLGPDDSVVRAFEHTVDALEAWLGAAVESETDSVYRRLAADGVAARSLFISACRARLGWADGSGLSAGS